MNALDVIREASAWLGVAGGGVATEVFRRFRSAEKTAKIALKRATDALASNEELKRRVDELAKTFESLRQGLRIELTNFEKDIEERLRNYTRGSRPDQFFDERHIEDLIEKLDKRVEELKADILRERGQRHALQKDIQDYNRNETESWRKLERTLGQIESMIESFEKQIEQIRHEISTIRR